MSKYCLPILAIFVLISSTPFAVAQEAIEEQQNNEFWIWLQNNIGVILDWVASHFPYDEHGMANFDGTCLFEDGGLHPDWQSCMFNLGRLETVEFLISSALYWIEKYVESSLYPIPIVVMGRTRGDRPRAPFPQYGASKKYSGISN